MLQYNFSDEDRMNPVYCLGCRAHIPKALSDATKGLCPSCMAKVPAASPPPVAAPPPSFSLGPQPPYQAYNPPPNPSAQPYGANVPVAPMPARPGVGQAAQQKANAKVIYISLGLFAVMFLGVLVFAQISDSQKKAKKLAMERRLYPLIQQLAEKYPDRKFAVLGQDGRAAMNAQLMDLRVDSVDLLTAENGYQASVTMSSTSAEAVAPEVFVSLFDEKGNELARSQVVAHLMKDLDPGKSKTTTDWIVLEKSGKVAIVAVDDDPVNRKREADEAATAKLQDEARKATIKAEEAIRGPMPIASAWDGITTEANRWLKDNLKDYDSMKLISCSEVVRYGSDKWAQSVRCRAKNSFGAFVVSEYLFVIRDRRVVDVMEL